MGFAFPGKCVAPGGCWGRWGAGLICMRLLAQLLQDAVTPLVMLPRLPSFFGTFLHLQLRMGRATWRYPGSAIIIVILGYFSAGACGWEGAASLGFAVGHSLHPSGAWQCLPWG